MLPATPYAYTLRLHAHNGNFFDPSSGVDLTFTVKASPALVRHARNFFVAHRSVSGSQIGFYPETGKRWLKRFAGHVTTVDATLEEVQGALLSCVMAAGTCLALLENRRKLFEVNPAQHPWIKGTVDFLTLLRRVRLEPGQKEILVGALVDKFRIASEASKSALAHHKNRTNDQSAFRYNRDVTLMGVRLAASQQLGHHYGWSQEITEEQRVTAKLIFDSYVKRRASKRERSAEE